MQAVAPSVMPARHVSLFSDTQNGTPSTLATPLHLPFSKRSSPNRIMKSSMSEHMASWNDNDRNLCGVPGPELERLYRAWGQGGAGIIETGNIMVDQASLEMKGNMIIPLQARYPGDGDPKPLSALDAARFEGFRQIAVAGKANGSLIIGQISHSGRQTTPDINPDPVSASAIEIEHKHGLPFATPHAASELEITTIIQSFVHSAIYLQAAGFDGVELHAAFSYLLAQFLAQRTNIRTDSYGGSIDNRTRIIVEIAREIRSQCRPDFILGIKLNSVEFQDRGLQPEESAAICRILEREKFDYVELGGGTFEKVGWGDERESTKQREGYFVEFAKQIVPELKQTKVFVTGGFRSVEGMERALGTFDGVSIGRPMAQETDLGRKLIKGEVEGAKKRAMSDHDFMLTGMVAGAQMMMVGEGRRPFDASVESEMERFKAVVGGFMDAMGKGKFVRWPVVDWDLL